MRVLDSIIDDAHVFYNFIHSRCEFHHSCRHKARHLLCCENNGIFDDGIVCRHWDYNYVVKHEEK